MSVMERRLQILIDQHRFALLEREAKQSGQSLAAVIRNAIDEHFEDAEGDASRAEAARRFLEFEHDTQEPEEDWETIKAGIEAEWDRMDRS